MINKDVKVKFDKTEGGDIVTRLSGKIEFEIELTDIAHTCKMQVSNENNYVALIMTRDMLSSLIKRQNLPTTRKEDKLSEKDFLEHMKARNIIEDLCNGLAGHLLQQAEEGKIKPKIITLEPKKIILPGQK